MGVLFDLLKTSTTRNVERIVDGQGSVRAFRKGRYHVWVYVHTLRPDMVERLEAAGLTCELGEHGNVVVATVPGKTSGR